VPASGADLAQRWIDELRGLGFGPPTPPTDRDAAAELALVRLGARRSSWNAADLRRECERIVAFNATLKREVLQDAACWTDELTCRRQLFKWLTRYNTKRRHSWCRYQSPVAYENSYSAMLPTAA